MLSTKEFLLKSSMNVLRDCERLLTLSPTLAERKKLQEIVAREMRFIEEGGLSVPRIREAA